MGVEARVVLHGAGEEEARAAADAAFRRLEQIDEALSDYRVESELARLVARAGQGEVAVSEDLYRVLAAAARFAEASDGAFDVTVRPLARLWRGALAEGRRPDAAALAAARDRVGWRRVSLDVAGRTAALAAETELDLGAIGKGYAADQALAVLDALGFPQALVDVGGDIAVGDAPPGAGGWEIAAGCGAFTPQRLVLARAGVATSGDTEQHVELDGVRYSHILDPRRGEPLAASPCVVAVAADAATADALASAASVLGPFAGRRLARRFDAWVDVAESGFRSLFDGRTLEGFVTRGGRYDGDARWSVEEGALTGRVGAGNAGGLIYTARPYTCFDFEVESFIDHPFDSGIFLRMVPDLKGAQVTLDDRPGGEIGAIYSDGYLEHNEAAGARYRRGAWNHFRVRLTGFDMRIEVWMNGEPITDYQLPAGSAGYAVSGLIGLQVHGGRDDPAENRARFRNIRIRELPVFPAGLPGFEPLFDGGDLARFAAVGDPTAFRVAGDTLEVLNRPGDGYLRTRETYEDFRLRLEFQISRMANSGVFLRADPQDPNPAYSGCEIQILDDFNWEAVTGTTLAPWQFTGSLYAAMAPARPALNSLGEWNVYEIEYVGSRLATALNGVALYQVDTHQLAAEPPFKERAPRGFIGLQRHSTPDADDDVVVRFRNVAVQRLGAR